MQLNVGKTDGRIRVILGILIVVLGFIFKSWWGIIGLIPIVTGMLGWCPLYAILDISSKKED